MISFGERFQIPYNMAYNLKIPSTQIGLFMGIAGLSVFVFAPLSNVMYRRLLAKTSLTVFFAMYLLFLAVNSFQIMYFQSTGLYVFVNFCTIGFYMACVIILQSYAFAQCPPQFGSQMGVFNQLMTSLGNTIGITMSVVIQQAIDQAVNTPKVLYDKVSISGTLWFFCVVLLVMIMISSFLGVLKNERGKFGFREALLQNTKGFEENLVSSDEMVEQHTF